MHLSMHRQINESVSDRASIVCDVQATADRARLAEQDRRRQDAGAGHRLLLLQRAQLHFSKHPQGNNHLSPSTYGLAW